MDVWVTGIPGGVLHWNGQFWSPVPAGEGLSAIWGSGPEDVWALGAKKIMRWDGRAWMTAIELDLAANAFLYSISGSGPSGVWATSHNNMGPASENVIVHWNGQAWSTRKLSVAGAGESWAVTSI